MSKMQPSLPMLACASLLAIALPAAAHAQNGEKRESVGGDVLDAVTSPLDDLNLRSKDIPLVLVNAQTNVYSIQGLSECAAVRAQVARLEEVLGPDADSEQDSDGLINKGLKTGGNMLSGFIPFRGVVRQLSGANARRAKWDAAIYAGIARRSFLKGYMKGKGCLDEEEAAVESAENVLGVSFGTSEEPVVVRESDGADRD